MLYLNSKPFPILQPYVLNFAQSTDVSASNYARVYKDWLRIDGKDMELDNGSLISYDDYANKYPIFAFDVSNEHSIFENVQTNYIRVEVEFNTAVAAPFYSTAVVTWEKQIKMMSTGDSVTIVRS